MADTPNRFVWLNIVFNFLGTRNDQGVRIYYDRILAAKDSVINYNGPYQIPGPIALGYLEVLNNSYSSIQLDELFFFNRALTAAEIAVLSQSSTWVGSVSDLKRFFSTLDKVQ